MCHHHGDADLVGVSEVGVKLRGNLALNVEVTGAVRLYRAASGGPQGYASCGQ